MASECPYRRSYRPDEYLFTGEQRVTVTEETCVGSVALGGAEVVAELGDWIYIEKRTYCEPTTSVYTVTCCGTEPGHMHAEVLTGSALLPETKRRILVKFVPGDVSNDAVQLSFLTRVNIGVVGGDRVVIKKCSDFEGVADARKVEISPMNSAAGRMKPKKADLPAVISPGMIVAAVEKARKSPLFGDLFSTVAFYRIDKVNEQQSTEAFFRIVENTSIFLSDFSQGLEIPNNAELVLNPRLPLLFESEYLTEKLSSLRQLFEHQKAAKCPCPVHINGPKGSCKRALVRLAALQSGFTYTEVSLFDYPNIPAFQKLFTPISEPTVLHIRHFSQCLRLLLWGQTYQGDKVTEALHRYFTSPTTHPVLIVASSQASDLPGSLRNLFHIHIDTELPNEADRMLALTALAQHYDVEMNCEVMSKRCVGKSYDDLVYLVEQCATADDVPAEIEKQLLLLRQRKGGAEGIPNVKWDDVGGLEHAKADIIDTVMLPLQRPDLFASGVRQRSGLLLYGPPGTGKTLLAKAVATECSLNFIAIKGPELLNMYIGESEANIRGVFQRGRDARPCVLFFDELDSLAPARGTGSDSGGVMDRIVSQLLTELDGAQKTSGLYVIGATNRPDLLDPALVRPGRFDKMVYLGLAEDKPSQVKILRALTNKFTLAPDCDLEQIANLCGDAYTGADFYALCSDALMLAYKEKVGRLEATVEAYNGEHYYEAAVSVNEYVEKFPEESKVEVGFAEFKSALGNFHPSLSADELSRYKSMKSRLESK